MGCSGERCGITYAVGQQGISVVVLFPLVTVAVVTVVMGLVPATQEQNPAQRRRVHGSRALSSSSPQ